MGLEAINILILLSFAILNTCGLIYIAKSFISFAWKIIDLQLQIREAYHME